MRYSVVHMTASYDSIATSKGEEDHAKARS
jgi:hypothetical protein